MTNQLCYFCCFWGAQGSGKVQHCACGRIITKGLRPGGIHRGVQSNCISLTVSHVLIISFSFPIKTNKADCTSLLLNPSVILSCCSVTHLSLGSIWIHSVFCQPLFRRQNNFPLFYAGKFSSLFPVQTANSVLGLPLLSKDLDKAPKWLFARSSINLTQPDTLHKCVGENRRVSFLHLQFNNPRKENFKRSFGIK